MENNQLIANYPEFFSYMLLGINPRKYENISLLFYLVGTRINAKDMHSG